MMAKFVVLSALIMLTAAYKEFILKENRTPKEILISQANSFNGTCSECKMLISRFAEAIKNPEKIAELKDLLRILCHETPYEDECRVMVNQLDHFIEKLEPYLKNPEKICQHFRLCSNRKIEYFHRINMLYAGKNVDEESARDLICEECQFAAQELKRSIEDEKTQQRLKQFISEEICSQLGSLRGKCDLLLEEFMPELMEELDNLLQNTKAFCADIGLCKRLIEPLTLPQDDSYNSQNMGNNNNTLRMPNSFVKPMNELTTGSILKTENLQTCKACRDALSKIKARLVDSVFQKVLENILYHKFCQKLPYEKSLCENLTMTYMPKFLAWTVVYLNQHDICKVLFKSSLM
uniref:Saposin B-type domain-containing protein n=1 Tax=Elaeophora elaphi TaxID=1147741 RepID=A0A0R3RYL9_9BILA